MSLSHPWPLRARPTPPADPREAAAWWSSRRRLRLADAAEEAEFQAWLETPAHARAFAEADGPMEALGDIATMADIRAIREAALAATPARIGASPSQYWRPIAASLAVAALLGGGLYASLPDRQASGPSEAPAIVTTEAIRPGTARRYETAMGERQAVVLDDGSTVTLNTASLIEVAYDDRTRAVRLLRDQAMFEVARHQPRPFVVTAGDRRITATGTAFDVRLEGEAVKVVLIEGHVRVTAKAPTGLDRIVPALGRQELSPGEALSALPGAPIRIAATDVERATSWLRGQAVFHNETLVEAATEMNRYAPRRIVIYDPRVAALRISGVFGTARPENFIAAVTAYHPVEADERTPGVVVLTWRG